MNDTHIATIPKNAKEELRIELSEYRGHRLISFRIWFESNSGEMRPGNSGFALRIERLATIGEALAKASSVVAEKGWLA